MQCVSKYLVLLTWYYTASSSHLFVKITASVTASQQLTTAPSAFAPFGSREEVSDLLIILLYVPLQCCSLLLDILLGFDVSYCK